MKYLLHFLIGSSWFVTLQFFTAVNRLRSKKNYSYFDYTIVSPIYLGFWNIISAIIAKKFNLSLRKRFLIITPMTYIASILISKKFKSYNFTNEEWGKYYIILFMKHFIMWNIIIYYLEKNIYT